MTPKEALQKDKYLIVEDFISQKDCEGLYNYFKQDLKNNPELFNSDPQSPIAASIHNYRWFVELLVAANPFISKLVEEPTIPTYTYSRLYYKGADLKPHKDRPSCEVSVTLNIKGDPWAIYFEKPDKSISEVILKPGHAVVYHGMEASHWREKFEGEECLQVFLHYVKSRGEHWEHYFDIKHHYLSQPSR